MFKKSITAAALVVGMTASSAFAGGNTTPNGPTTPPAVAVAAAINTVLNASGSGVTVTATQTANGDFVIRNVVTGQVLATVTSVFLAGFLANY